MIETLLFTLLGIFILVLMISVALLIAELAEEYPRTGAMIFGIIILICFGWLLGDTFRHSGLFP